MKKVVVNVALFTLTIGLHSGGASGQEVIEGADESKPVRPDVFEGDLRDLPEIPPWQPGDPIIEIPSGDVIEPPEDDEDDGENEDGEDRRATKTLGGARLTRAGSLREGLAPVPDPLLQFQQNSVLREPDLVFSTPELNFDGISFTGAMPPDVVGEVGPNHYIEMVNDSGAAFAIYDKAGNLLAGPSSLDLLAPSGSPCATGLGDPIVVYDRLADRWLMSEFADRSTGNHLCVYISQTPDPVSGGWFFYQFTTPDFPDYFKYGVWPDAYYVSTNESSAAVYALDRNQMLSGSPATFQRFTGPALAAFGFQAFIPSDLDGPTPPPSGSPNFFMRHRDDEAHNPGSNNPTQDFLEIWEFHVDFANAANSTFTGPINIPVAEFDSELCGFVSFECFPQPSTSTGLDPLREVIMWRLQYLNFGSHETLVGNLTTDVDGTDHGGLRWFELRTTGGGSFSLFQEGTHAPDVAHRWMGSISMDKDGNIALGYSVSSPGLSIFPSIRYAGRREGDPAGALPQGEFTLIDGAASQTFSTRWGDYSSLNVDPADDCTFWYTNEYVRADGNWNTRTGSFRFSSCGAAPPIVKCARQPVTMGCTVNGMSGKTCKGTPGTDVIVGRNNPGVKDVINGLGGKDVVRGLRGGDRICGGRGKDRLFGGKGKDRLFGQSGRDRLFGGRENDTLDGGLKRDFCNGGAGKDTAARCERRVSIP